MTTKLSQVLKDKIMSNRLLESIRWTTFNKCQDMFFEFKKIIIEYTKKYKKDEEIYKQLKKYFNKNIKNSKKFNECAFSTKPQTQALIIKKLTTFNFKPRTFKSYLDIGAGDCSITREVAKTLKIPFKDVYATEILDKNDECKEIHYFKMVDDKLPPEFEGKFDLITCLMSLHHIGPGILPYIVKSLSPNGILVIREHDVESKNLTMFLDALHAFYMYVFSDELPNFTKKYVSCYKSMKEWTRLIEKEGATLSGLRKASQNYGEKYHAAYMKMQKEKAKGEKTGSKEINLQSLIVDEPSSHDLQSLIVDELPQSTIGGNEFNKLPEKITECAITEQGRKTCASDFIVEAVGDIIGAKGKKLDEIMDKAKEITKCDSERCVLSKVKGKIDKSLIEKDIAQNFKVKGPTDTSLLSNLDLDKVLLQWASKFKDFFANNFNMADYEKTGDTLATIDMCDDVYDKNYTTFACIINSDVSSGPGKHWMVLFVDLRDDKKWTIEFFNSSGNPPAEPWKNWMKKTAEQLKAACGDDKDIEIIDVSKGIENQRSKTECGIYSLYYIWRRLENTSYEFFQKNKIPDKWMFEMRQHLFENSPLEGSTFDFDEYSKYATIKWEK